MRIEPAERITLAITDFSRRLRAHPENLLEGFADTEIMAGLPFIFASHEDTGRFQQYVATALDIADAATKVFIVGSAKTGFSLDPDQSFTPFHESSDIDIVVIDAELFDDVWRTMLAWDYLTMRRRSRPEQQWLYQRHDEVWSGWYDPPTWHFRERGGLEVLFPAALKSLRDFSYRWLSAFRSLSRYKDHPEIPRHKASARLYRTRTHAAMYHAMGLRTLRRKLLREQIDAL